MKKRILALMLAGAMSLGIAGSTTTVSNADALFVDGIFTVRVECYIDSAPQNIQVKENGGKRLYNQYEYNITKTIFYLSDGQVVEDPFYQNFSLMADNQMNVGGLFIPNKCESGDGRYYEVADNLTSIVNGVEVDSSYIDYNIKIPASAFGKFGLESVPLPDQQGLIYRMFDPRNGDHVYTANPDEKNAMVAEGWVMEGNPGFSYPDPEQGEPVYRLKNDASGEHIFTKDVREKSKLAKAGWTVENGGEPVFYSTFLIKGSTPKGMVYRLFNPNAKSAIDSHIYTQDENEIKTLINKHGWEQDNNGEPVFYFCDF